MKFVLPTVLIIVGVIHLLPLSGALGGAPLATLYGLQFDEPNLAILMRHRAVLFGLLGGFLVYAAFKPPLQPAAFVGGLISVLSFLYLAWAVGGYNEKIARVFSADIFALVLLVVGGGAHVLAQRR